MEFTSFVDLVKVHGKAAPSEETVAVIESDRLDQFFRDPAHHREIAMDLMATSDTPMTTGISSIALAAGDTAGYLPFGHPGGGFRESSVWVALVDPTPSAV